MHLKLSENPRARYSPTEARLFGILAKSNSPIKLDDLALEHYAPGPLPFNYKPTVRVILNQLMKKIEWNKEAFKIEKIKTQGEKELTYIIKRKRR